MDMWTPERRSEIMSRVRSRGNKATELRLIEIFKNYGIIGWRRNQKLPGKPDFVFRKERLCVFVDGCFWHRCPLHATFPNSNVEFWEKKFVYNCGRDKMVNRQLKQMGWRVLRIWQHELKRKDEAWLSKRILRLLDR
jgi:DNA mismatch endonuclease (patch repair protein)